MEGPSDIERVELNYEDDEIVVLISSDDEPQEFKTTIGVVKWSGTINNLIADCGIDTKIPLHVEGRILQKVLAFLKHRAENFRQLPTEGASTAGAAPQEPSEWDCAFCDQLDDNELYPLILAANFLAVTCLLEAATKTVAGTIKGKTTEEIRERHNIVNDFTAEEEEEIRKENAWCEP